MVVASLALIAVAVTAAPAFGSGLKWNSTGIFGTVSGTLTLKKNGAEAVSCALSGYIATENEEGYAEIEGWDGFHPWVETKCANGKYFGWDIIGPVSQKVISGKVTYYLNFQTCCEGVGPAPWSGRTWVSLAPEQVFTNGSGATPSSMSFNETVIGETWTYKEKITATGKLNFKQEGGGLLTVGPA